MPLLPPMDLPLVEKPEVVIDGRADESADQAAEASDFVVYRPSQEPNRPRRLVALTSEEALYVHFEAKSPSQRTYGRGTVDATPAGTTTTSASSSTPRGAPSGEPCFSSIPWAYRETESSCAARMLR